MRSPAGFPTRCPHIVGFFSCKKSLVYVSKPAFFSFNALSHFLPFVTLIQQQKTFFLYINETYESLIKTCTICGIPYCKISTGVVLLGGIR